MKVHPYTSTRTVYKLFISYLIRVDLRLLFICNKVDAIFSCNLSVFIKKISFSEVVMADICCATKQIISDIAIKSHEIKKCVSFSIEVE